MPNPSPGTHLNTLQLAVMRALWRRGEATVQDVTDEVRPRRALTSVATVLKRLEGDGLVAHRKEGRQYVYRPVASERDVRRASVGGLVDALFGGDRDALISHLVRESDVDAETLDRLRRQVDAAQEAPDSDTSADAPDAS